MDPAVPRLVGQMHITKRRDQARANTRFGFLKWLDYFNKIIPACYADRAGHDPIDRLVGTGRIVCGTPDDAIAQIEKFYEKQRRVRLLPAGERKDL